MRSLESLNSAAASPVNISPGRSSASLAAKLTWLRIIDTMFNHFF
jgi:hypothetical protein